MSPDEPAKPTPEQEKLRVELESLRQEMRLRQREVAAREREVAAKQRESRLPSNALVAAAALILAAIVTQGIGGCLNLRLKEKELEGNLIVAASRSDSRIETADLLDFLIDAGLIEDADGTIRHAIENPSTLPVLRSPGSSQAIVLTVSPMVGVVVSHPRLDRPTTLWIPPPGSASLTLPGAEALRLHAEILDPERRRVRLTLLPAQGEQSFDSIEMVEGDLDELSGPPELEELRVELLRVVPPAAPPAAAPEDEPEEDEP